MAVAPAQVRALRAHSRRLGSALLLAALTLPCLPRIAVAQAWRYTATTEAEFISVGPAGSMLMPTDVSVGANGYVYVADGVNDRIVAFSADGAVVELITGVGEETLARPMAVHVDTTGRLWIVDGGNHRVVVRAANGTLDRIIEVPESVSAEPPDLTDALYVEDADVLWLVNNNGHELLRLDLATSEWRHIGRRGESLGEFYFPFELTALPRGDIAGSGREPGKQTAV